MDLFEHIENTKAYKAWISSSHAERKHNVYCRYQDVDIEDGEEYFLVYEALSEKRFFIEIIADTYFMIELSESEARLFIEHQKSWVFPHLNLARSTIKELNTITF